MTSSSAFFFQAEDGIRDGHVTGVQTCALPIYFLALLHRASLGVAGPDAVARLDISATELGAFVMVQLGLYALMQVPAGLAIDRWGARRALLVATPVSGSAQILIAVATACPAAPAAPAAPA